MATPRDPFQKERREVGVLPCEFQGETVPMILRHADVRRAAKDWKTFSSDAPFRIPIPSEEDVRSMRQLPIEVDPPDHDGYRKIVEPIFKRAKDAEMIARVEALIEKRIGEALGGEPIEIVREFAVPVQSHALSYLLNVPEAEAETWISWGTHVFRDIGAGEKKGAALEDYLNRQLDVSVAHPGEDFFSALTQAKFRGRPLTREEMLGFANLTFAGGRDTVINTIASIIGYLAGNPQALEFLREDPKRITNAGEEFFRVISPLTHIGRVCPVATEVHGHMVEPGGRASLCWASANYDEAAFDSPEEVRLDRKPNPHLAFGSGTHLCLGAAHARLITRTLLAKLCESVGAITLIEAEELVEHEAEYSRPVGFHSLTVQMEPR